MSMIPSPFSVQEATRPLFILGVLLVVLGILGIAIPKFFSIAISVIIALMLIFAGIFLFFYNKTLAKPNRMSWMKAFAPLLTGLFLLFKPFALVIVLGLAIFIYLILDATATITLALEWRDFPGWKLFFFNGLVSLILAGVFIVFWPYSSYWYVGWMIGISLILDGICLIVFSSSIDLLN